MSYTTFLSGRDPGDPGAINAIQDVQKSGLEPGTLDRANVRIFPGTAEELAKTIHSNVEWAAEILENHILIEFPHTDKSGRAIFTRLKCLPPIKTKDGKDLKYLQPKGTPTHPYILPEVWAAKDDHAKPLWITEGEKKALKLIQHGQLAISLPGVFNFREKTTDGGGFVTHELTLALREFNWRKRSAYIAFDADFQTNENVLDALLELAMRLYHEGADVRIISLNAAQGKGIDDHLAGIPKVDDEILALKTAGVALPDFITPEMVKSATRAIAQAAQTKTATDTLAKQLAPSLKVKAQSLFDDVSKKRKEILRKGTAQAGAGEPVQEIYEFLNGSLILRKDGVPLLLADFEARIVEVCHLESVSMIGAMVPLRDRHKGATS